MISHRVEDNALAPHAPILARAVAEATSAAAPRIGADDVEIVFRTGRSLLPELGFSGQLRGSHRIDMVIDQAVMAARGDISLDLARMIAHEMHHCMRMRSVGYGRRLGEVMVSEGLACQFEREIFGGMVPIYATPLRDNEQARVASLAAHEWRLPGYDHGAWFFGTDRRRLPRFAGYALGFMLVGRFMRASGRRAAELVHTHPDDIVSL